MKKYLLIILVGFCLPLQAQVSNNLETAELYFQSLFKKGDFAMIQRILTEDAEYLQAEGLPYGGHYIGFDQWMKMFGQVQVLVSLEILNDPVLFQNSKGDVVANFKVRFTANSTKKVLEMPIMELVEFTDRKIARITPYYFDTKAFVDFLIAID